MKPYEIKNMIIDDEFNGEESVTADFTHNDKDYSITLKKEDLEMINAWVLRMVHLFQQIYQVLSLNQ
ncbi:hypothetical protein Q5O89_26810 [Peribacillus frigoritolerans]|nr:hypothetical protein [Peribacillus frigoritolerans]